MARSLAAFVVFAALSDARLERDGGAGASGRRSPGRVGPSTFPRGPLPATLSCRDGTFLRTASFPSPEEVAASAPPLRFPGAEISNGALVNASLPDPARPYRYRLDFQVPDTGLGLVRGHAGVQIGDEAVASRLARKHGRLTFVSLSAHPLVLRHNLLRSAAYLDPLVAGGHRWVVLDGRAGSFAGAGAAYSCARSHPALVSDWDGDVLVFLHDDVHLLPGFELDLYRQLDRLEAEAAAGGPGFAPGWRETAAGRADGGGAGPAGWGGTTSVSRDGWCVIGAAGGDAQGRISGRLMDFGFRPNERRPEAGPREARFLLDESILVLRRSGPARFGARGEGFHCYGAEVCLSCLAAGSDVHVLDTVSVCHKCFGPEAELMSADAHFGPWISGVDWASVTAAGEAMGLRWHGAASTAGLRGTACMPPELRVAMPPRYGEE